MMRCNSLIVATVAAVLLGSVVVAGQDATEIMKKSHLAYYYAADDGVADLHMSIVDKKGKERVREFTMLRLDIDEGGDQRYYTYFRRPSDVARLTFMVHKTVRGNDKRWIYIPSVDLVKQISADDKNSSFVGSDFTYEDVSGRLWSEDNHSLIGDSTIDSSAVFMVESIPREKYKGFARKLSYIDKKTFLPLYEQFFNGKGKLMRRFRAEIVEEIDGILTVTRRSMENLKKKRKTTVEFSNVAYNVGLTADLFTERYLKSPPRKFIK